jgi:hypothetical protein
LTLLKTFRKSGVPAEESGLTGLVVMNQRYYFFGASEAPAFAKATAWLKDQ